eukprot:1755076-Amphidinium_carterae.1
MVPHQLAGVTQLQLYACHDVVTGRSVKYIQHQASASKSLNGYNGPRQHAVSPAMLSSVAYTLILSVALVSASLKALFNMNYVSIHTLKPWC